MINRYIIKINYDSLKIDICSKGSIRYPRGGYLLKPNIGTLPAQTLRVKDNIAINGRFLYDMGAGVCFMFSKDFINDSSLLNKKRKLWVKEGECPVPQHSGRIDHHVSLFDGDQIKEPNGLFGSS